MKMRMQQVFLSATVQLHMDDTSRSIAKQAVDAVKGFKESKQIKIQLSLGILCGAMAFFICRNFQDPKLGRDFAIKNLDILLSQYKNVYSDLVQEEEDG